MTRLSSLVAWPGLLAVAVLLATLGGCSRALKSNGDGSAGGLGGAGSGGTDSGGSGQATGGASGAGMASVDGGPDAGSGGMDGSNAHDAGVPCPANAGPGPRFQFCAGSELYRADVLCGDDGECACAATYLGYCVFGCVALTSGMAACLIPSPDAAAQDAPPIPDASKLDVLTRSPPDGANLHPSCPRGNFAGFRKYFCFGGAVFASGIACGADQPCDCQASFRAYCANRCVELPDEAAECQ